jgi:hypothetical protein
MSNNFMFGDDEGDENAHDPPITAKDHKKRMLT